MDKKSARLIPIDPAHWGLDRFQYKAASIWELHLKLKTEDIIIKPANHVPNKWYHFKAYQLCRTVPLNFILFCINKRENKKRETQ